MEYIDTIVLGMERAMIGCHQVPKGKELFSLKEYNQSIETEAKAIQAYGLFDSAAPSFSNYYPEVSAEDLDPEKNPEGFVYPIYRGLSMVTVRKNFDPVDFSANDGAVLKESIPLLLGLAVYPNHEMLVGNELGSIVEAEWQNSYKIKNTDIIVPGGINLRLKLDGKSNPKIARAVMMKPPSIHSGSITIEFAWKPSHENLTPEEFRNKIGTYDDKGELIRRIATKVRRYYEYSLVSHGADPYAQRVGENGNITNPLLAHTRDSFSEKFFTKSMYLVSFKDTSCLGEPIKKEIETNSNPSNFNTMREYLVTLCALLAVPTENVADATLQETIKTKLGELKTLSASSETLKTELQTAKNDLQTAQSSLQAEKDKVSNLEKFAAQVRADAERVYKLAEGDKADENTLKVLREGTLEALSAIVKPLSDKIENQYPGKCDDCGSTHISRQSAQQGGEGKPTTPKADAEVVNKLADSIHNGNLTKSNWE